MIFQFCLITIVLIQKILNFLFAYLFLFDLKFGLYPYSDIQDTFFSKIISSNALLFKISCTFIGILLSCFSIFLCIWIFKKKRLLSIAIVLLILSSLEIIFFTSRFMELKKVISLIDNCDLYHQVQVGCSIPTDIF